MKKLAILLLFAVACSEYHVKPANITNYFLSATVTDQTLDNFYSGMGRYDGKQDATILISSAHTADLVNPDPLSLVHESNLGDVNVSQSGNTFMVTILDETFTINANHITTDGDKWEYEGYSTGSLDSSVYFEFYVTKK